MEQTIIDQVVGPVIKFLTSHITKHIGYVVCSTKHVTHMKERLKTLQDKSADLKTKMESNKINQLEVPKGVSDWLKQVESVGEKVKSMSTDGGGCLDLKKRYQAGSEAWKDTEKIQELLKQASEFEWTDVPIAFGRVDSKIGSSTTFAPASSGADVFTSRDKPFKEALKFFQEEENKSQVIGLCGMGGVGKTTMMKQLQTVARDKKMFDWIVEVVIGRDPSMKSIQNDISIQIGGRHLIEETLSARANNLHRKFEEILKMSKKILVILDDVWEEIELSDIGLTSPLPKGVKLFLTSRRIDICQKIADSVGSDLQEVRIEGLEEKEAENFFARLTTLSEKYDPDLYDIGRDIVKKCGHLPLAIKIISKTLKLQKKVPVWKATRDSLNHNDLDTNLQKVIKMSYECIGDEDREILLQCGLFREDANIPIEILTRYAWGLNMFKHVYTLGEARVRTETCVQNLMNANLLLNGDKLGCVKMHDLVLLFVLNTVTTSDEPWIISHGDISRCQRLQVSKPCKRISLTCKGMSEFPKDFKYPNLSLLQLEHGDMSLKFPEGFYRSIERINVIAYYDMQFMLLPRSLECSNNLTTLILNECKLMYDCSFIGDLKNLEVLRFAGCGIRMLPSKIGNLEKLKLLDVTGNKHLRIDDGVFQKLVNLEELYMKVFERNAIKFTDANLKELETISGHLCALQIEFVKKETMPKNISFRLDNFMISMGCLLQEKEEANAGKNTLKLVTDHKSDIQDCKINELFKKTENLELQVEDMICLECVVPNHPYDQLPFRCLRDLEVSNCPQLKHLFTTCMASGFKKLERLKVSSCSIFEELVRNDASEINSESETIRFDKLKFLSLKKLPKLVSLFHIDNTVELPQLVELELEWLPNFTSIYPEKHTSADLHSSFLHSQVNIPNLEKLKIRTMENLKQIWGCEIASSNISLLKEINVEDCDSLVNLFPTNPMGLLKHLEELRVWECGSVEVIFNLEFGWEGEVGSSNLRSIEALKLKHLREVWRIKGGENNSSCLIRGFEAVERIIIVRSERFRNLFTPTNIKFDFRALVDIVINNKKDDRHIDVDGCDALSSVIPYYEVGQMQKLRMLLLGTCDQLLDVFELSNNSGGGGTDNTTLAVPRLENINVPQLSSLKQLSILSCNLLHHVFTFSTLESLMQLEVFEIRDCEAMNVIVKKDNGQQSNKVVVFPRLRDLYLSALPNLEGFFLGKNDFKWPSLEYVLLDNCPKMKVFTIGHSTAPKLKYIHTKLGKHDVEGGLNFHLEKPPQSPLASSESTSLWSFHNLIEFSWQTNSSVITCLVPSNVLPELQKLEMISLSCKDVEEVFGVVEREETNSGLDVVEIPNLRHMDLSYLSSLKYIWKNNNPGTVLHFPNLTTLRIHKCDRLQHVFTSSMIGSLLQLQDLHISYCRVMEVIVKVDHEEGESKSECDAKLKLPHLNSLKLEHLSSLKGFCLGTVLEFPNLTKLHIERCNRLKYVFTSSMVGNILQLQDLHISYCPSIEVLAKELGEEEDESEEEEAEEDEAEEEEESEEDEAEEEEESEEDEEEEEEEEEEEDVEEEEEECKRDVEVKQILLPCLKSLRLVGLKNLKGFCLGKYDFSLPSLHTLEIRSCRKITTFTNGHVATPALRVIDTSLGSCYAGAEDINSFIKTKRHEGHFDSET